MYLYLELLYFTGDMSQITASSDVSLCTVKEENKRNRFKKPKKAKDYTTSQNDAARIPLEGGGAVQCQCLSQSP